MHVCIIGAGVVGLTSAYYLARQGHGVTVVDRATDAGAETSHANGGQLSYNYVAPLADASVPGKLPGWLLGPDSPLRFTPRLDPHQWRWCLAFLGNCTDARARQTLTDLLPLAFRSRDALAELCRRHSLSFAHRQSGKLVVYHHPRALEGARRQMDFQARLGSEQEACDASRCREIEPALETDRLGIVGGIYTPGDAAGDCQLFCKGLTALLQEPQYGVDFRFGTEVSELRLESHRVRSAETPGESFTADHFVVAAGIASRRLLKPLGLSPPLYPITGYSLSLPIGEEHRPPSVSVTDASAKVVYARLGDQLRVAGMADLNGGVDSRATGRLALLKRQAQAMFPLGGDYDQARVWTGHRPATPNSKPIVGETRYRNLWLNIGHGALGFTLACGCGELLAERMRERLG